jgi:Sigma-70, region 4
MARWRTIASSQLWTLASSGRYVLDARQMDRNASITLAYFDGLTHTEIAQLTGLPPGTIKGRIRLGAAKLRQPLAATRTTTPAPQRPEAPRAATTRRRDRNPVRRDPRTAPFTTQTALEVR